MRRPLCAAAAVMAALGLTSAQTKPLPVTIDIKPGDQETLLEDREGLIPVLLLSTPQFDAGSADEASVRLGPSGTEASPLKSMTEDVDKDGDIDRLFLFRVRDMGIKCGVTVMRLTGRTTDGRSIEGSENVRIEGCR